MTVSPIILVHGAWHGGWSWDRLIPHLKGLGAEVIAPDLPGHGDNPLPLDHVTLARYADYIIDIVDNLEKPAVLVGHSMSGAIISEVAERRPEKVKALVYLAAYLLPSGIAMSKRMKEDQGSEAARHSKKVDGLPAVVMAEEGLREAVYAGCLDSDKDWAAARVQPQAIAPFVTPVTLTETNYGRVPRIYVECTEDRAITIAMQRQMQAEQPCREVFTLAAGHVPQVSVPDQVATILREVATQ